MADEITGAVEETTPVEPERPDWLPDNFKDEAAFAKSYGELSNKLREQGTELNQYKAWAEQMQQQQAQPDLEEAKNELLSRYEEDPISTMAWLAQQAAGVGQQQAAQQLMPLQQAQGEILAAQAEQAMRSEHPDWEQIKPLVTAKLGEDPGLLTETDAQTLVGATRGLNRVVKVVRSEMTAEQVQSLSERQNDLARQQKLGVQTLTGGGERPDESPESESAYLARLRSAMSNTYSGLERSSI